MLMRRSALFVGMSSVVAFAGSVSQADVIVTNLAEPLRATTDIGNNPNPVPPPTPGAPDWSWAAQSFTTDTLSYTLTTIDVIGGLESTMPPPVIVAELRADSAGQIGALITTLIAPSFAGDPSPRTLTPSAPVILAPSTTYWIVIGSEAPGDGTLGLSYANTNESVGTGVIGAYADSQDSGGTWNYGTPSPYFIQVVGEPTVNCTPCPGDANGDRMVSFDDITRVLISWGTSCP